MAIDEAKWIRLIAKVIADTQDKRIRWRLSKPLPEDPTSPYGELLETHLMSGRRVATYLGSVENVAFRMDAFEGMGLLNLGQVLSLSIAKPDGKILMKVPVQAGLTDLMRSIDEQLANVDDFVDKYLGE